MVSNQAYLFLIFTLNGIFIGFLFDIFRIIRKTFKTNDIATYIEDVIFWILAGITILFTMYKFSDGELRIYTIIGITIGVVIYMLTVSTFIINISVYFVNMIKKVINFLIRIIKYPLKNYKKCKNIE